MAESRQQTVNPFKKPLEDFEALHPNRITYKMPQPGTITESINIGFEYSIKDIPVKSAVSSRERRDWTKGTPFEKFGYNPDEQVPWHGKLSENHLYVRVGPLATDNAGTILYLDSEHRLSRIETTEPGAKERKIIDIFYEQRNTEYTSDTENERLRKVTECLMRDGKMIPIKMTDYIYTSPEMDSGFETKITDF